MTRTAKGCVSIQVFKNRLRLVWHYAGKRYYLYPGLPDGILNRKAAEMKARAIEMDISSGNFDPTLFKYKPESAQKKLNLTVVELWAKFTAHKSKEIAPSTKIQYRSLGVRLKEFFGNKLARDVSESLAQDFIDWLCDRNSRGTVHHKLVLVKACWSWGSNLYLTTTFPWQHIRVKIPPKQMLKPFTRNEIRAIVYGFREHPSLSHYTDFVEFLFSTGCRTGEAIGLRWGHLTEDCDSAWIGEIVTRGQRRPVKTGKARTITLNQRIQSMLLDRRHRLKKWYPDDLVFPGIDGGPISDNQFRESAWKPILKKLGIEYRKPYLTRHSLISHCLKDGMDPVALAQLTGHNVTTLFENYAGVVSSRPMLPDILGGER